MKAVLIIEGKPHMRIADLDELGRITEQLDEGGVRYEVSYRKEPTAIEMIADLDAEIVMLSNNLARIGSMLRVIRSESIRGRVEAQRAEIKKRIVRAQAEMTTIEEAYFAEIRKSRRAAKYPPVLISPVRMKFVEEAE